jgi:hypothetical protein
VQEQPLCFVEIRMPEGSNLHPHEYKLLTVGQSTRGYARGQIVHTIPINAGKDFTNPLNGRPIQRKLGQ